jgi:hypothetical protein
MPAPSQQWVYFIQDPDGLIKIGTTASDPWKRLRQGQGYNPRTLTLLGVIKSNGDTERELHRRFVAHRRIREWFAPAPELLALIASEASVPSKPDPGPYSYCEVCGIRANAQRECRNCGREAVEEVAS